MSLNHLRIQSPLKHTPVEAEGSVEHDMPNESQPEEVVGWKVWRKLAECRQHRRVKWKWQSMIQHERWCKIKIIIIAINHIGNREGPHEQDRRHDVCNLQWTWANEEFELTHFGMFPPFGSWWWYCSTTTVAMTDIPTMIIILAKYWPGRSRCWGSF